MRTSSALSTGIGFIDEMLDGGLQPGTLTLVYGATGVGKTQFGLSFLNAGLTAGGRRGCLLDFVTRGDSQQHAEYARRLFGWNLSEGVVERASVWAAGKLLPDTFKGLEYSGKRVNREDVSEEDWETWHSILVRKLDQVTAFLYSHFVAGGRRMMIDGVEPCAKESESVQFELIDYVLRQTKTAPDWVARQLFRETYRANEAKVMANLYDPGEISTILLQTSNELLLDDLISRELPQGDTATNANTIILMGRIRLGAKLTRGIFVLKHRGRACSEEIVPFRITERGIETGE